MLWALMHVHPTHPGSLLDVLMMSTSLPTTCCCAWVSIQCEPHIELAINQQHVCCCMVFVNADHCDLPLHLLHTLLLEVRDCPAPRAQLQCRPLGSEKILTYKPQCCPSEGLAVRSCKWKAACDAFMLRRLPLQVQTVVHAIHMCHSLLVRLSPRALEVVADSMWKLLALFVPSFMPVLLEAGDTGM
jgi:hypothetical protein